MSLVSILLIRPNRGFSTQTVRSTVCRSLAAEVQHVSVCRAMSRVYS